MFLITRDPFIGIFSKMVPLAKQYNTRLVLVNRRDYYGSLRYSTGDRAAIQSAIDSTNPKAGIAVLDGFMEERARELHDLLVELVANNAIPKARPKDNTGGIIIVGWSLGTLWMTALLANIATFPVADIRLGDYLRRVIFYGVFPCRHRGIDSVT